LATKWQRIRGSADERRAHAVDKDVELAGKGAARERRPPGPHHGRALQDLTP
jgi:hypothetical protein